MLLKQIPTDFIEKRNEKRVVLFAGAGLSIPSGLPSGSQLAMELADELQKNNFIERPLPSFPLALSVVAQQFTVAFGRQKLIEHLLRRFEESSLKPNEGHRLAVKLFPQIVTTNYDRLLEDAIRHEGRNPMVVVRDVQLPYSSLPDRTVIYKLHGDVGTPERIVIASRDYTKIPLSEGLKTELRSFLNTKTFVFIGYGIADPDFLEQLDLCRNIVGSDNMHKSYAVIPEVERDLLFQKQCDLDNIDLLSNTAIGFLRDLDAMVLASAGKTVATHVATGLTKTVPTAEEAEYRKAMCEEFKYIEFRGIPVLGGYLRVEIDKLFVPLSAIPTLKDQPSEGNKAKDSAQNKPSDDRRQKSMFKETAEGKSIFDILSQNQKVVILGDPGSGKTTLLRYVGFQLCLPEPQPEKVGLKEPLLPVFIPLRELAAYLRAEKKGTIETFLPEVLATSDLEKHLDIVRSALRDGLAIVLIDGLDEVASTEERNHIYGLVQQFAEKFHKCRFILTSRRVGYMAPLIEPKLEHFTVKPLSKAEIQAFIELWCKQTETENEKTNLLEAIENPRVLALAENPLLVSILARVYKSYRNLPERRAALYAKCVEALLTTWDLTRDLPPVFQDVREANRVMGPIAFWIHRDMEGQLVTREQILVKLTELGNLPRNEAPPVVLNRIEERSGLIRQVGLNQYAFSHLTFQEYYVARELVSGGKPFKQLRKFLRNDRWQEVITLTAGLLDDLGSPLLTEFLQNFVVEPEFPVNPSSLHLVKLDILLGCLRDKVEPERHIFRYVEKTLLAIVERASETRRYRVLSLLPRLRGFGRTQLGATVYEAMRTLISDSRPAVAMNAAIFGYSLVRDDVERANHMMYVIEHGPADLPLMGSAGVVVFQLVESAKDSEFENSMRKRVRNVPLDRRKKVVESGRPFTRSLDPFVSFWMDPEEKGVLKVSVANE